MCWIGHNMKSLYGKVLPLLLFLEICLPGRADTLIVTKERPWHSATQISQAMIANSVTDRVGYILADFSNGKSIQIQKPLIITQFEIPPITTPSRLASETDSSKYLSLQESLQTLSGSSPKIKTLLQPYLDAFNLTISPEIKRYQNGEIKIDGAWWSKADYAAKLARDEKAEEERAAKIQETQRQIEQAKAEEERKAKEEKRRQKLEELNSQARELNKWLDARNLVIKANAERISRLPKEERAKLREKQKQVIAQLNKINSVTSIGLNLADYTNIILKVKPEIDGLLPEIDGYDYLFSSGATAAIQAYTDALNFWRECLTKSESERFASLTDEMYSRFKRYGIEKFKVESVPLFWEYATSKTSEIQALVVSEESNVQNRKGVSQVSK